MWGRCLLGFPTDLRHSGRASACPPASSAEIGPYCRVIERVVCLTAFRDDLAATLGDCTAAAAVSGVGTADAVPTIELKAATHTLRPNGAWA